MITSRQLKAARALIGWNQAKLAASANLSLPTIKRMEGSKGAIRGNAKSIFAIQTALEVGGVEFIDSDNGGLGVRLKPNS